MRKLKPVELLVLTALMSIGSKSEAQEIEELPITNLDSVTVSGQYYYWSGPTIQYNQGSTPDSLYGWGAARPPEPTPTRQAKALDCATKYGPYQVPPGYTPKITTNYGFRETATNHSTYPATNVPPGTTGWQRLHGIHESTNKVIWVLPEGFGTFQGYLTTLVHELAHANGISSDTTAEAAAQAAYAAYIADNGAKCGGLASPP